MTFRQPFVKTKSLMIVASRIVLVMLAALALVWIAFPQVHWEGTEIAFAPGTPDPNVYKTSHLFGWPLTWISWERSWNNAAGYNEAGFGAFYPFNFGIHVFVILFPLLFLPCRWMTRLSRPQIR